MSNAECLDTAPSKTTYCLVYQQQLFICKVYGWTSCAFIIIAMSAYFIATHQNIFDLWHPSISRNLRSIICYAHFIMELTLGVVMLGLTEEMNFITMHILFFVFFIAMGYPFGMVFFVYKMPSIITTLLAIAGMCGSMSFYGYVTKADVGSIKNLRIMMIVGLIFDGFLNLLCRVQKLGFFLSGISIIVFVLLTACDIQNIQLIGHRAQSNRRLATKLSMAGALRLYIIFVGCYFHLCSFLRKKK
jgi:FtsH-binding integral membrane protein